MKYLMILMFGFAISAQAAVDETVTSATVTELEKPAVIGDRFNLRIEPHWMAQSEIALDLQYKLGNHFSIGPTLAYMDGDESIHSSGNSEFAFFSDYETERLKYGLRAVYYLQGVNVSSTFFSLSANRAKNKVTNDRYKIVFGSGGDLAGEGEFTEDQVAFAAGFQWQISAFTINVGGGMAWYNTPDSFDMNLSDGTTEKHDLESQKTNLFVDAGLGLSF